VKLRGIPKKREFLARMLERLGAIKLLERALTTRPPALVVLTYHRIAERGTDPFYDPVISAAPQTFRAQLEWLRKRMRILTLLELDERVRLGPPWKEPAAFVTFDDGYRDNFDEAVPILRELGVPATFFIPTEFLESPKLPWWDHVAYVIKQTARRQLRLKRSPGDLDSPLAVELDGNSRDSAIAAVIRAILDERVADLPWFLEHLATEAEVNVETESLGRDLFMGWAEVRHLTDSDGRLTVGSHAHSHQNLSKLDPESQARELGLSKQILGERLGREIAAIAYPFGWPGTYTHATKTAAQEAGYRLAFASTTGVNYPGVLDPFEINRIGVGSGDSPAMLRARTALLSAFGRSFL
jgi:peptidoglycan/xylan/chitin deacetylase (PgdA/CDA1 family)